MEENLIPERISPPRVEARIYIAVDGGDWVAGHDETYIMFEGDVDQVMTWMKENVPGYGEVDEQTAREWIKKAEIEIGG